MAVRIGLAFNLKPEAPANPAGADSDSPSSDEPPSRALRPDLSQPDLYAEWDEPATIDAVERALSTVGQVYRLEANASRYHGKPPDELDWSDRQRQRRAVGGLRDRRGRRRSSRRPPIRM